jgi:hypothetical protein
MYLVQGKGELKPVQIVFSSLWLFFYYKDLVMKSVLTSRSTLPDSVLFSWIWMPSQEW